MSLESFFEDLKPNELQGGLQRLQAHVFEQILSAKDVYTVKEALRMFLPIAFEDYQDLSTTSTSLASHSMKPATLAKLRELYYRHQYSQHLRFLLENVALNWYSAFPDVEQKLLFDDFFVSGDQVVSLGVLSSALGGLDHSFPLKLVAKFIKTICIKTSAEQLFLLHKRDAKDSQRLLFSWKETVNVIGNLPDRLANRFQRDLDPFFFSESYTIHFLKDCVKVFEKSAKDQGGKIGAAEEFIRIGFAELVRKFCMLGKTATVVSTLFPYLIHLPSNNALAEVILSITAASIPEIHRDQFVDTLIKELLKLSLPKMRTLELFTSLFRSHMLTEHSYKVLLTYKIFLQRSYPPSIFEVLVDFLALKFTKDELSWVPVFAKLVGMWGDSSYLKHTPEEQHKNLTIVLLLFIRHLSQDIVDQGMLMNPFLQGVQSHLNSPSASTRKLGMVTAECFAEVATASVKLSFEVPVDDTVLFLRSLVKIPLIPESTPTASQDSTPTGSSEAAVEKEAIVEPKRQKGKTVKISLADVDPDEVVKRDVDNDDESSGSDDEEGGEEKDTESDSDDESLDAFDMEEEEEESGPVGKVTKPIFYVRDCLSALKSTDDPERIQVALKVAPSLLKGASKAEREELAVEFARTLLYLNDDYSLDHFEDNRRNSLVAACAASPAKVADFLAQQFFERNYNLAQRFDVLEIISLSARELSSSGEEEERVSKQEKEQEMAEEQQLIVDKMAQQGKAPSHSDIIAIRIKRKTRRFSSRPVGKETKRTKPSPFAPVAGNFFFPLLNHYDRPKLSFNLLGEDSLLLERFVQTLAIVLYSSVNAAQFLAMARAFWDFTFAIRLHAPPNVRKQLIFGLLLIVTGAAGNRLREEFYQDMVETHAWLLEIFHEDPDVECRSMAAQITNAIVDIFKEGQMGLFDLNSE